MKTQTATELLRGRSAVGWLRERDIDLLLCAELHVPGVLRDRFASLCTSNSVTFCGAWVSHADMNGESDLVVAFETGRTQHVLLVENKISAGFQPDQPERYAERAARWRQEIAGHVSTVLICPRHYRVRADCDLFDATLTYEDLIEALRNAHDPRSAFLAQALADGIASYRQGYVLVPDETVTHVWTTIWDMASAEYPALQMEKPSAKPSRSGWIYFRRPRGFSESDAKRSVIVYKASRGQVDLQFGNMSPGDLAAVTSGFLDPDMTVVKAAKSASVRLNVPTIDFGSREECDKDQIRTGLAQAERLRRFFLEHGIGERLASFLSSEYLQPAVFTEYV